MKKKERRFSHSSQQMWKIMQSYHISHPKALGLQVSSITKRLYEEKELKCLKNLLNVFDGFL